MKEITSRYAEALYSLKRDENKLLDAQSEVRELKKVLLENPDFIVLLDSSYKSIDEKIDIIDKALKGVDEEENLLDNQIIARVVIDEDNDWALEDIEDNFLMEVLRNEFANRLRKEIEDWYSLFFYDIILKEDVQYEWNNN